MITKVEVLLLLIVAILPALNGYPLEEDGSSLEPSKPSELKVNPLLTAQNLGQQKNTNNSEDDDSTEPTYIEETYIEVLLPGTPQLNTSALASLLNITVANNTFVTNSTNEEQESADEVSSSEKTIAPAQYSENNASDRSTRDTSSENDDESLENEYSNSNKYLEQDSADTSADEKIVTPILYSQKKVNDRPSRDTSSENEEATKNKETTNLSRSRISVQEQESADVSTEKTDASSSEKIVAPVLYSKKNVSDRLTRDTSSENDDDSRESEGSSEEKTNSNKSQSEGDNSDESSSEEQVNEQHNLTGRLRARRSTDDNDKQHSEEKSIVSNKYGSDDEKVVYVTPSNKKLQDRKQQF